MINPSAFFNINEAIKMGYIARASYSDIFWLANVINLDAINSTTSSPSPYPPFLIRRTLGGCGTADLAVLAGGG
jgi:hypothetical protein